MSFIFLLITPFNTTGKAYLDLSSLVLYSHGVILSLLFHNLRDIKVAKSSRSNAPAPTITDNATTAYRGRSETTNEQSVMLY
jgi:hypothetical protein